MDGEKSKESKEKLVAKKKIVTQLHHITYGDGQHKESLTIVLRKGEHFIATCVRRWCSKNVSIQFIRWLRYTADRLEMDRSINKIDLDGDSK
jgi:hypothetical protein